MGKMAVPYGASGGQRGADSAEMIAAQIWGQGLGNAFLLAGAWSLRAKSTENDLIYASVTMGYARCRTIV